MEKYRSTVLIIVFVVVAIVFAIRNLQPKISEFMTVEEELKTKSSELQDSSRKLETIKAQMNNNESQSTEISKKIYKPEESGLDVEASMMVPFDDIVEMAKYNGVKIFSVEYVYNPPTDEFVKNTSAQYNVCQINMQLIGDYVDLESFFDDIYKYPYLVNFDKIEIKSYQKNKKILIANVQLKLYAQK